MGGAKSKIGDTPDSKRASGKETGGSVIDKLTEAQLDEFREAFNSFDKDGGGSIDSKELKDLMASVGQNPTDDELAEMIRIADADGTGDIDFAEFVTLMAHKMADEKSEETLRAAFSVFDTSGDGFISAEEMRRIMINVGEPVSAGHLQLRAPPITAHTHTCCSPRLRTVTAGPPGRQVTLEDVEQVIRKVDIDGDGVINYEEFTKVGVFPEGQRIDARLAHCPPKPFGRSIRNAPPTPEQVIIEEKATSFETTDKK